MLRKVLGLTFRAQICCDWLAIAAYAEKLPITYVPAVSLDRMGTLRTICETPRLAHEIVLYGAQLQIFLQLDRWVRHITLQVQKRWTMQVLPLNVVHTRKHYPPTHGTYIYIARIVSHFCDFFKITIARGNNYIISSTPNNPTKPPTNANPPTNLT